jgi:hypothetical protein
MRAFAVSLALAAVVAAPAGAEPRTLDVLPTARILTAPPLASSARSGSFTFESPDGATGFECALDDAAFAPCASPTAYGPLADGRHTFRVAGLDAGGNAGDAATYTWTVDTVAPNATVVAAPATASATAFAEFSFTSDEPGVSFTCSLDGVAGGLCVSPVAYSALRIGGHTFSVTPTDAAGNVGPPATYSWTVAPSARTPAAVAGLHATAGYRSVTVSWTPTTDPGFDHVVVLRATGSGPASLPVYEGVDTSFVDTSVDNSQVYRYVALNIDRAGNASENASVVVRPEALLLAPGAGAAVKGPVRLAWTPVRGAVLYNVQLWRGGRKILSAWPHRARLGLRARWRYGGRAYALSSGTYQWFVWPAFGRRPRVTYGPALGASEFTRVG